MVAVGRRLRAALGPRARERRASAPAGEDRQDGRAGDRAVAAAAVQVGRPAGGRGATGPVVVVGPSRRAGTAEEREPRIDRSAA